MARMLVIYRRPADVVAFDEHYFSVHVPLAKALPGLLKYETSRGPIAPLAGASDTHLIALLQFASLQAIKDAFASELGRACAADRKRLAPNDQDVQIFLFDDQAL